MFEIVVVGLVIFDHKLDVDVRKNFAAKSVAEVRAVFQIACVVGVAAFAVGDALLIDGVEIGVVFVFVEVKIGQQVCGDEVEIAEIAAGGWHLVADASSEVEPPDFGV